MFSFKKFTSFIEMVGLFIQKYICQKQRLAGATIALASA
jgi:hypothetical protein